MLQVFGRRKADFFIGIVGLMMAIELFFAWGSLSGFNRSPEILPYWNLLNYWIFPPSIWLFIKYSSDDNFRFEPKSFILFIPAIIFYLIEIFKELFGMNLMDYSLWRWFSDYLPMLATTTALLYFWINYVQHHKRVPFKATHSVILSQLRLLLLMLSLSLICVLWIVFSFIGWDNFEWIVMVLSVLFIGLALMNFLESQNFPSFAGQNASSKFPQFNDQENLDLLEQTLKENQYFLKPNLPIKELAAEMGIPDRYLSFLINNYHQKNYKEFINKYRVDAFIQKAQSSKKDRMTLLGLALESGFSSKSTFNHVFKSQTGKTPKEYLDSM